MLAKESGIAHEDIEMMLRGELPDLGIDDYKKLGEALFPSFPLGVRALIMGLRQDLELGIGVAHFERIIQPKLDALEDALKKHPLPREAMYAARQEIIYPNALLPFTPTYPIFEGDYVSPEDQIIYSQSDDHRPSRAKIPLAEKPRLAALDGVHFRP